MQSFVLTSSVRRALAVALFGTALAVGLSACGSSANTSTSVASGSGSGGGVNTAARYQARLSLAKCFRAHGINVPDPSQNGGPAGGGGGGVFRSLQGYSRAQVQSATQACQQYIAQAFPRANLSPQQQAQFRQAFVKFAQCMRSHGVNVPDPTTGSGGGFGFGGGGAAGGGFRSIDKNSPAFQSAITACQSLRPRFGRGGPGGPGGAVPAPGA